MRHATDLGDQRFQGYAMVATDELSAGSEFALSIEFPVRSKGDCQVVNVARGFSPIAFSDVRCDRDGGFAHLIRQSEAFSWWKGLGAFVDQIGEVHRFLPSNQISKARDLRHRSNRGNRRTGLIPHPLIPNLIPNPQPPIP
jgi:hypothetical protein